MLTVTLPTAALTGLNYRRLRSYVERRDLVLCDKLPGERCSPDAIAVFRLKVCAAMRPLGFAVVPAFYFAAPTLDRVFGPLLNTKNQVPVAAVAALFAGRGMNVPVPGPNGRPAHVDLGALAAELARDWATLAGAPRRTPARVQGVPPAHRQPSEARETGRGYASRKPRKGAGRPTALLPIPWSCVTVTLLPGGRLAYDVVAYSAPWGGSGQRTRYLSGEVFHLKDRSDDGWLGRSRLSRAPAVLQAALGRQEYSTNIWNYAAAPSGALKVPDGISPEGLSRMRQFFESQYAGSANAKRVLLLDEGTDFQPISASPEDAEALASRQFTVSEIARLFQCPPPLIQDYSNNSFTNTATAELWFAQRTLLPWARKIECEFQRSVFADTSGTYAHELDFTSMTRGDYATRTAATVALVAAGVMTIDEARDQEGLAPLGGSATASAVGGSATASAEIEV